MAKALAQLLEIEAKKRGAAAQAHERASTTDPEARVTKMADGGFRPAFNGEFATDTGTQIIVEVDATNAGSDPTAQPLGRGGSTWEPPRPRRSTRSGRPRPSA